MSNIVARPEDFPAVVYLCEEKLSVSSSCKYKILAHLWLSSTIYTDHIMSSVGTIDDRQDQCSLW